MALRRHSGAGHRVGACRLDGRSPESITPGRCVNGKSWGYGFRARGLKPAPRNDSADSMRYPLIEVDPSGIAPFDQVDLPLAAPLLELLLARDRIDNVVVTFEPDEKMHAVSRGESARGIRLVFIHPANQIIGHADIEGSMLSTREDVDVVHKRSAWGYGFRAPAA